MVCSCVEHEHMNTPKQDVNLNYEPTFLLRNSLDDHYAILKSPWPNAHLERQLDVVFWSVCLCPSDSTSICNSTSDSNDSYLFDCAKVEFRDVTFAYPTRPGALVLDKVSFTAEPDQAGA